VVAVRLDFQKVDDLLHAGAVAQELPLRRTPVEAPGQDAAAHVDQAAGHDVGQRAHRRVEGDVLEGAADAQPRPHVRRLVRDLPPAEVNAAALGMVEAVDAVEHTGLSGAVGADDAE